MELLLPNLFVRAVLRSFAGALLFAFAFQAVAADAGTDGTAVFCNTGGNAQLIDSLGGTPDPGGTWVGPNGAHSGVFIPGSDPAGVYTYTVIMAPDPPASATVTVTVHAQPSAGISGSHTVCVNDPSFNLTAHLGGVITPGGVWTDPSAMVVTATFTPGTSPAGIYTYTVTGTPPCIVASATVTVTVNALPNAGGNGSHTVCSNSAPFDLFTHLTGSPQNTGAWTGPSATPVPAMYTPGTSAPGVYTYTVPGTAPCPSASATVTVSQTTAPNAGVSRSISVCSDEASFDMRLRLNGTPDVGGSWTGPGGAHGPMFDPAVDVTGPYVYTVTGASPCADALATLTITVRQAPDAGADSSVTLCSTDGIYALFSALPGADVGGSWLDPIGAAHSGNFDPATGLTGDYTYTVAGQSPCTADMATVQVTVNPAPNAGTGVAVVRCSNDPAFGLFGQLTGSPMNGGTWTGPSGPHGTQFTPGTDPPGDYIYTVPGVLPCANATAVVNVSIVAAPNAGTDHDTTVCGNDAAFDLFALLGGTPDATGSWTAPGGGATTATFTPGTSPEGIYTYTVAGTSPCSNAQATVTVDVIAPPNPGTNGSITACSSEGSVDLFTYLGGTPANGGTWAMPDGTPHNGTYLPGSQPGGNYTYTVQGNAPCTSRSAVVQVVRVIAPNAGTDGTITVCSTNGPFPLISVLGGSPNGTGSWLGPTNAPDSGTFDPATSAQGQYKYVVVGTSPCVNDTGFVTVTVHQAPNAGQNASVLVCSSAVLFNLIDSLNGTPNAGGTWTDPSSGSSDGVFVPGTSIQGGYTYSVAGQTPCLAASAVVVVNVNRQPIAGTSATVTRCSTDGPVDLFTQLGGTPDAGGSWNGPGGASSGVFIPGTSQAGAYVYTVSGTAPCTNATATITMVVNQAPNAGTGGTLTICQGTASVDLFTGLTGTPDLTGVWTELTTTGQLSGNFFNPGASPPGNYDFLYTVSGIAQCGDATATVRVTIVPILEAGSNGTLAACRTNTQVNLFTGLGGGPQPGGQWIDLSGVGLALNGQYLNATMVAAGTYQFRYRLSGIAGCDSDSSMVTVTVVAAPNAGTNGSTIACGDATNFPLFPFLGNDPSTGGSWWRDASFTIPFSGTYSPLTDDPGTYYYRVSGLAPCSAASASVVVQEVQPANAGQDAPSLVCSNSTPFNMTQALGGTPDPNGTWFFDDQNHGVLFVPGLDLQGIYEYRVPGGFPCTQDIAYLNVSVTPKAIAGLNSSTTACSGDGPFLLFDALGGSPDNGGSWLDGNFVSTSGTFIPGTTTPGNFYYVVIGTAPCINDTALVSVFVDPSPNAGTPGAASLCANGPIVNLFSYLGGTPDPFGTWVGPPPGNLPFNGQFNPATSAPGLYTYTVTNSCGFDVSTVSVQVSQPANAGCSASTTVCSSDQAFAMVELLTCNPALNGTWVGPLPNLTPVTGVFAPGGMNPSVPGTYRYTVSGVGACPSVSTTLSVVVNPARYAGNDASVSLCRSDGVFQLFPLLGPAAQAGGSWFFNLLPHTPSIQPSVDVTGTYTYVVYGLAPCQNDTARVFVQISQPANAGTDGLIQVCSNAPLFQLINSLTGGPALNGNWFDPFGVAFTGIFTPGTDQGGVYKYRVPGNGGCPADSSFVTVIQSDAVDAGDPGGQVVVCSNAPEFELFNYLNGTPQSGGDWYDPNGVAFTGTYFPGLSLPGVYKYKRIGTAPCASDSATVTVFQSTASNAGINTLAEICSSQNPVPLIGLLGGSPDNNGTWTFNGDEHGPFFDPAIDIGGAYIYTVPGQAPCPTAIAQVSITLNQAPRAGTDGFITACAGSTSVGLYPALNGNPTTGGTWTTGCAQGTLTNGVFDATGMLAGSSCTFTYTHAAAGPCPSVSAQVTVTIVDALDAGEDGSMQACWGQVVNLYEQLGGTPQTGGSWNNVDGATGVIGGFFNTGAVASGTTWRFDHILLSSGGCVPDTARVTVEVLDGPNAGCGGPASICSSSAAVSLPTYVGCEPDGGGFWLGPDLQPHSGSFVPATSQVGVYRYVVEGFGACPSDTAYVPVSLTEAPNAGSDANLSICSSDAFVDMFTLLGPDAQPGGNWIYVTGGSLPHSSIYNPAIDFEGTYRYRVSGQPPCGQVDAYVNVTEPQAPNAGVAPPPFSLCTSQDPVDMRSYLGPQAASNGTWTFVTGGDTPHGTFFDPGSDLAGVYRYTVEGMPPCTSATVELTIGLVTAGNAGQNAIVQACSSQTEVNLFDQLGPQAQTGGTWTDQGGSGALIGDLFNPSVAGNGGWEFLYTIPASSPCQSVSATVRVNVTSGSSAGGDSTLTICGAEVAYPLIDALGGDPDPGGIWTEGAGGTSVPNGILDASQLPIGGQTAFVYTIEDPGCGNVQATVLLTTTAFPDPGVGSALVLCATMDPIDLFAELSGTPETGGVWTGPLGGASNGTFDPAVNAAGPYRYTVLGNAACADSIAVLNITVNQPPDAGGNGQIILCDTLTAFPLITGLQGTPDAGGVWTDLSGSGGLSGVTLNTTGLLPDEYEYRYLVQVPGCADDASILKIVVVSSPEVIGLHTICNEQDRTYVVTFTIASGDANSYEVLGAEGTITAGPPFVFTSDPIVVSQPFFATLHDAYACSMIQVETSSPCSFETEVFVPESFSPNGDGVNENFEIPGIEGFPDNSIVIFNRWGAEMYSGAGYDNRSVVWDGSSPDALIAGSAPAGTYFYVLELGNGSEPLTGFIQLVR
ncbi:MAG: gliding motility-associated C-terminal domain-containing protein [Flavobacteriales bacterium]|nr:gliding motility-associated C-terminal domain-containing protein [Flavobacteriales bacterium]